MLQENVEVLRRAWEIFCREPITLARVERGELEGILDLMSPSVVLDWTQIGAPDADVVHGHEGVRQFWRTWFSEFGRVEFTVERIEAQGDRVATVVTQHGFGGSSGVSVEMTYGLVATLRDRKIVRLEHFRNAHKALEAVGLRE